MYLDEIVNVPALWEKIEKLFLLFYLFTLFFNFKISISQYSLLVNLDITGDLMTVFFYHNPSKLDLCEN